MIAAVVAMALALAAFVGSLIYLVVRFDRTSTRVADLLGEIRGFDKAVIEANVATHAANLQLGETAHEYAEYRRRAEAQLTALKEDIDALDEELTRGAEHVPGAATRSVADRMRRIRETAARRDAPGRGPANTAAVPDGAPSDPGRAGGGSG